MRFAHAFAFPSGAGGSYAPFLGGTPTAATIGTAYTWVPTTSGLTGTLTFALLAGTAPSGTTFSTTTGGFPGTPTTAQTRTGISIQVTDSASPTPNVLSISGLSIVVSAALVLTNAPATTVAINAAYSYTPTTTGGRAPITWAIVNTPSWASFNTSTGALTGTAPGSGEVDASINITGTDADGRTVATGSFTITVSALSLSPMHYDAFTGAISTQINGKALTQGGLSWVPLLGATGSATAAVLNGNGDIAISGAQANAVVIQPGQTSDFVVTRRLSPFWDETVSPNAGTDWAMHLASNGAANSWNRVSGGWSAAINGGVPRTFSGTSLTATSSGTTRESVSGGGGAAGLGSSGDVSLLLQIPSGATRTIDMYLNGWRQGVGGHDFAADGVTLNCQAGFGDGVSTNVTVVSRWVTDFWAGDPTALAFIAQRSPRVRQINLDGSLDLRLSGLYTMSPPSALAFSMFDISGGSAEVAVTNVQSVSVQNLATTAISGAFGTWSGTVHVAAADVPAGRYITHQVEWTLPGSGSVILGKSANEKIGWVFGSEGQSLMQRLWTDGGSGLTGTGTLVDGSRDIAASQDGMRVWRSDTTHYPSQLMQTFGSLASVSSLNMAFMRSGKGGSFLLNPATPSAGRSVGTDNHQATLDCIDRAGGLVYIFNDHIGQFEGSNSGSAISGGFAANTTYQASMEAALVAKYADFDSHMGLTNGTVKGVLSLLNAFNTAGSDVNWNAVRRFLSSMAYKYPTRFYDGPVMYDELHISTDPFHHASYTETCRRLAYLDAKLMGFGSTDRNGPTLKSVTWVNSNTLDVKFNLTVGTTIAIINANAVAASGFNGGLWFDTVDGTRAHLVNATSASVTATDTIRFGFSGTPFVGGAGTGAVGAIYGSNPFNPTNDGGTTGSGINGSFTTQACMIQETVTSEPALPLRPYYNFAYSTTDATHDFMTPA